MSDNQEETIQSKLVQGKPVVVTDLWKDNIQWEPDAETTQFIRRADLFSEKAIRVLSKPVRNTVQTHAFDKATGKMLDRVVFIDGHPYVLAAASGFLDIPKHEEKSYESKASFALYFGVHVKNPNRMVDGLELLAEAADCLVETDKIVGALLPLFMIPIQKPCAVQPECPPAPEGMDVAAVEGLKRLWEAMPTKFEPNGHLVMGYWHVMQDDKSLVEELWGSLLNNEGELPKTVLE